jgi:hypothetical protein
VNGVHIIKQNIVMRTMYRIYQDGDSYYPQKWDNDKQDYDYWLLMILCWSVEGAKKVIKREIDKIRELRLKELSKIREYHYFEENEL